MTKQSNRKRALLAAVLAVTVLTLSACGAPAAGGAKSGSAPVVEAYTGSLGDPRLAGQWNLVSVDDQGGYGFHIAYSYDGELYIMRNGQCYGALIESLYSLEDDGSWWAPVAAIEVQDGTFTFTHVVENEKAPIDLKVEYAFSDIEKTAIGGREAYDFYYRTTQDDQLTLHLTGSFKMGPTDVRDVDLTLVYEREGVTSSRNAGILWAELIGDWQDSYGNKWTFSRRKGGDDLGFVMTSDGKEYKSLPEGYYAVSIGAKEVDGSMVYFMDLSYEDSNLSNIYNARVVSFDGDELCLEQQTGQMLIFTR